MRRRRRNKRNASTKLGLLFIVLILSLATISASYAHWEEILDIYADMETTEWEIKDCDFRIGYEDLSIVVGTGTPGYWKNHEEAWPVDEITIGGVTYQKGSKTEYGTAIYWLDTQPSQDMSILMFHHLVAAKLNVLIGCESGCIDQTIIDADIWMTPPPTGHGPVGSGVLGGSQAWLIGEPLKNMLDDYNKGWQCAPHRDNVPHNDYDYNDFVVDIDIDGLYIQDYLVELNFTFEAMARGAAYHHDLLLFIPSGTFGVDGTYTLTYYDKDGNPIGIPVTAPFLDTSDINLTIFPNTWDALPPTAGHRWCANAIDGTEVFPGRTTTVQFNFSGFFCDALDLDDYTLDDIGVHGKDLFFNPQLYVRNTGEYIDQDDPRFIPVPNDWIWPEEFAAIWTVYPYNAVTTEGVTEGNPPTFTQHWYTETLTNPTTYKWDPI